MRMKHRRGVMLGRRAFAELSFRRFQASRLSSVVALFFLVFLLFSEGALASQVSASDTGKSLEIFEKKLWREGGAVDILPLELVAPPLRDALPLARCEQDGMVIRLKEGGFFEGVIYPYGFMGDDAWSVCSSSSSSSETVGEEAEKMIRVVEEPSPPLLLFPWVGWTYRVSAPAPEKGRSQEFSVVLEALCEDRSPVCQTTIMLVIPAIDEIGEPSGENSSSDFPFSRLCAAETVERSRVYNDEATYVDQFIFDSFSLSFSLPSDCTNFVAELSFADDADIPFGLLAVMPPYQYPLSYIFSVPTMAQPFESNAATAPEVQFEVPYTIRCGGKEETMICADTLHFYVNPRPAPACPSQNRTSGTANTVILVGPSSTTKGMDLAKLSGLECYSSEKEKSRIVIENVSLSILNDRSSLSPPIPGTLTVISDGAAFRYDAPPEEMDVMVRIQLECATDRSNDDANKTTITQEKNTVPISYSSFSAACELTLVFLVSAEYASHTNFTEPPFDNDHQSSICPTSSPSDGNDDQNDGGDSVHPPSWLFDVSYDVPLGGHLSGQLRIPTNMNTSVETREKIDACPAIRFTQAVATASFSHSNLWTTDGASNWSKNDVNTDDDEEGNTNPNVFLVDPSWLFSDGFSPPASSLLSSSNDFDSLSSLPIQHHSGAFFLNLLGQFAYQSPYNSSVLANRNATPASTNPSQSGKNDTASAPSSFIDVVGVYVWCVTGDYFGSIRLFFTNYEIIPSEDEDSQGSDESNGNNTAFPSSPPSSSLNRCSNVYYYTTPVGVSLFNSLAGINGQTPCAIDRYYSLTQQPSRGWLKLNSSGEFVYSPLPELETAVEAKFDMFCANRLLCEGVIFIVVSDAFAGDNESNPQPDHPSDGNASSSSPSPSTPPFSSVISCEGACTAHPSWITLPAHHFWDTNMEVDSLSSPLRDDHVGVEDERAHRWFSIRWRGDALVLSTQTAIGNMGIRFPTFDIVENFSSFRPSLSDAQRYSASFNGSCLSHQGLEGLAEDVWVWDQLQANNGTGRVGPLYNKGVSWYQTFGGKHDQCNIFQTYDSACQYAPLLTPAVVSTSSSSSLLRGIWSVAIKDCTATWTSSLSYPRLTQLHQDGQFSFPPSTGIFSSSSMNSTTGFLPNIAHNSISSSSGSSSSVPPQGAVFRFSAPRRVEGLLFTEAVQPRSWVAPQEGIEVNVEASQVRIGLQQYVEVIKTALEYPFTTDAQFFEFVVEESPSGFPLSNTTVTSTTDTTTLFAEGRTAEGDALLQSSISAPGDIGFGINLLIYPSLASNSPSVELTQNHRVVGFKWLQQQWHAPGNEECHTCTGVKLRCYAGDDFSTGSYEEDVFPSGDCPPGVGRVYFYKGPEITERDVREKCSDGSFSTPSSLTSSSLSAPSAEGWLLNRRGFSLTKDCANHYQNLTLRGVLSGSGKLTAEQKAALHVEGMLLLQVLMSDGYRYNIRLHISMFVSFVNTVLTAGGVDVLSVIRDDLQANQNAGGESVENSTTSTTLSPAASNPTSTTRKPTANFNPDVKDDDTENDGITDTANATDEDDPATTDNPNSTTTEMNGATGAATIRRAALNVSGELHVCRSSRYFPVLDPLGTSTPLDPLPLPGGVEPSHGSLCVDDLSRTYGPQDWSLVVVNAAPLHPYLQLRIDSIFVDYQRVVWPIASSDTTEDTVRVYLRYVDPVTHEVLERPPSSILSVPSFSLTSTKNESVESSTPQCHWWKFTAPFLDYRAVGDVSTPSGASSSSSSSLSFLLSSSMSPEMARALHINQSQFAFLFVPGALGWTGEAEVVVEATLLPSSSAFIRTVPSPLAASDSSNSSPSSSRVEFRQKLHVTPYLTDASRYGVSTTVSGKDSSTNAVNAGNKDKQDFFAFFVITAISVLLILSVVIFFVADSKKPLPQWVPRGDILRSTVRSLLPHALRKSRKKAHRVATTDGSDGEIHVVEIPIVKTNFKDMYEAMSSGKY